MLSIVRPRKNHTHTVYISSQTHLPTTILSIQFQNVKPRWKTPHQFLQLPPQPPPLPPPQQQTKPVYAKNDAKPRSKPVDPPDSARLHPWAAVYLRAVRFFRPIENQIRSILGEPLTTTEKTQVHADTEVLVSREIVTPDQVFPVTGEAQHVPGGTSSTAAAAADPAEVDISSYDQYRKPTNQSPRQASPRISEDQIRQILQGFEGSGLHAQQQQQQGKQQKEEEDVDPTLQLLQQLLGSVGGGANSNGDPSATMFSAGGLAQLLAQKIQDPNTFAQSQAQDGQQQQQQQQRTAPTTARAAQLWRVVHAMTALMMGVYIAWKTPFDGSLTMRQQSSAAAELGYRTNFFWVFATVQLLLQSTRFFLDNGRLQTASSAGGGIMGAGGAGGGGMWMGLVESVLPDPYRGYLRLGRRYSVILSTVVADAMVVLFVLGCVAWWRGVR